MKDLNKALRVEEYYSSVRSPLMLDEIDEYNAMGSNLRLYDKDNHNQQDDEDYQDIEQEIKVVDYLSRSSLEPKENDHFYMTQVINQSRQAPLNATQAGNLYNTKNSVIGSSFKLSNSLLKQSNQKKSTQSLVNKSQVIKSTIKRKQISPINNRTREGTILDKYMNFNDFSQYGINTKGQNFKQKNALNASALIMNSNIDCLHSTAPINMAMINRIQNEDQMTAFGHTDVVNSTHNLRRINSKESCNDKNQQFDMSSLYYSGAQGSSNQKNQKTGINTQSSVTPLKDHRKKQILISNILQQEGLNHENNKKYFLNLTLQQLIQQQKTGVNKIEDYKNQNENNLDNQKSFKNQKRLNKTLDNFRDDNTNYNQTQDNSDLRSFINNFIQGNQTNQQFQTQNGYNKQISMSQNKLSNTMKMSDFNNTQQLFERKQNNPNKKSKSSLKNTQNINFNEETTPSGRVQIINPKKYSALSTYSMNTALPTTTHINQVKSRKLVNSKQGIHINSAAKLNSQVTHKRQVSQDKGMIQQIINLYQEETIGQPKANDQKNKTYGPGMKNQNVYQSQSKHKTNSNLNEYLSNSKPKNTGVNSHRKKVKPGMSNSFINIMSDKVNNPLIAMSNPRNYENFNCFQNIEQPALYNNTTQVTNQKMKNEIVQKKIQERELVQSALLNEMNNQYMDFDNHMNPYVSKKTAQMIKREQIKEIQNKTQPIPKHVLEMAKAEAINFSTGTSIILNRQPSRESNKSRSKARIQGSKVMKIDEKQIQPKQAIPETRKIQKVENSSHIYNNRNTIILDENRDQEKDSLDTQNNYQNSKLDRFILGKQIGQGAYAVVRVATLKKENKKYAIKIYDKSKLTDSNRQRSVRREIKLLQKMNHQNIVKIFEAFETDNHVYLVMEYVGGGNLYSYLKQHSGSKLDEEEAKRIFKQILTALQYCHRKSIAHRDIKLENILLDDEKNVKIIDFGFSTCIPNDKKIKMFCGTPSYMAPEIVLKLEYAGPPADIWASGVLLFALMNGKFPFRGDTDKDLYRRIQRGTFDMHNQFVSTYLIAFLTRMIQVNADSRPSADDLINDEWFQVKADEVNQDNEKLKADYISDQKRIFKAKILSKIPVEKTKNTISLLPQNEKQIGQKVYSHNINLGTINQCNFQNQPSNLKQNSNLQDQSDYGNHQQNAMKKLNQEAYQAYYNTSGAINGQVNNNMQNPYYNNFFNSNIGQVQQQQQPQNNPAFYQNINNMMTNNFPNQMRNSPSKNGMNTNTNPVTFPVNFTQQPPNQIGTPQVFGSPTGFSCAAGMINNNFNIVNNITQVTCLQQPLIHENGQAQNQNLTGGQQNNQNTNQENDQSSSKKTDCNYQPASDLDEDIIESIAYMGYHRSHVVSQLECDSSHLSHIYKKLKEEKMSMTQNRPLSMQPHSRRPQAHQNYINNHNNAIFSPNFIQSINDSLRVPGDNDNSGDYTQMYSDKNELKLLNCNNNNYDSFSPKINSQLYSDT